MIIWTASSNVDLRENITIYLKIIDLNLIDFEEIIWYLHILKCGNK